MTLDRARAAFAALAACAPAGPSERLDQDPREVAFAGRVYGVTYAVDRAICTDHLVARLVAPDDRLTTPAGSLWVVDVDRDGRRDLAVYRKHDGLRDHFGYLTIYLDRGEALGRVEPLEAKWKEGRWAWLDVSRLPALTDPDGALMRRVRAEDDAGGS